MKRDGESKETRLVEQGRGHAGCYENKKERVYDAGAVRQPWPVHNDDAFYIICRQPGNQYARCRRNELAPHITNRAASNWRAPHLDYWHLFALSSVMRRVMELHIENCAPRIPDSCVCFRYACRGTTWGLWPSTCGGMTPCKIATRLEISQIPP